MAVHKDTIGMGSKYASPKNSKSIQEIVDMGGQYLCSIKAQFKSETVFANIGNFKTSGSLPLTKTFLKEKKGIKGMVYQDLKDHIDKFSGKFPVIIKEIIYKMPDNSKMVFHRYNGDDSMPEKLLFDEIKIPGQNGEKRKILKIKSINMQDENVLLLKEIIPHSLDCAINIAERMKDDDVMAVVCATVSVAKTKNKK